MDLSNKENMLPQIVETKIVKKEQQESVSRDAPESTSDSYKKAQAKIKQQILVAPLLTFDEKIQYTGNINISPDKGRMNSNLKS